MRETERESGVLTLIAWDLLPTSPHFAPFASFESFFVSSEHSRYARKYVNPKLTAGAATVLQRVYLQIRERAQTGNSLPITTRQLESLVRLAQARARAELRDWVTDADARDVISLMELSLVQAYTTETGSIDMGRRGGMSLAKQTKAFISELNRSCDRRGSATFTTADLLATADRMALAIADFNGFVDMLNDQSYLLKKGPKLWQLMTHSRGFSQR